MLLGGRCLNKILILLSSLLLVPTFESFAQPRPRGRALAEPAFEYWIRVLPDGPQQGRWSFNIRNLSSSELTCVWEARGRNAESGGGSTAVRGSLTVPPRGAIYAHAPSGASLSGPSATCTDRGHHVYTGRRLENPPH